MLTDAARAEIQATTPILGQHIATPESMTIFEAKAAAAQSTPQTNGQDSKNRRNQLPRIHKPHRPGRDHRVNLEEPDRLNPEKIRVIAALPQLLEAARQVTATTGKGIQIHALAMLDEEPQLMKTTVEKRESDQRDSWNRFHDIKGIEIKSAPDSPARALLQGKGSYFVPGREVTMTQLAKIVKMVEGGRSLGSSPAPEQSGACRLRLPRCRQCIARSSRRSRTAYRCRRSRG